jgi:Xaa-Pro aminopeptidase
LLLCSDALIESLRAARLVPVMRLDQIQSALRDAGLDGWLFFDHHERDPLAYRVLGLKAGHASRRWYYLIPASGTPRGLVHRIESGTLDSLPGEKAVYSTWREQRDGLRAMLDGSRRVAMQYSPNCAIPYVANVDAGTVELIRGFGVDVVSSAELIQLFEARWTPAMLEMHLEAGRKTDQLRREAFELVGGALARNQTITEYAVQQFVLKGFADAGLITNHPPIVGVNANASNPHYCPTEKSCRPIRRGDLLLLDLWSKVNHPDAVYYDVTWMAFCGNEPSPRMKDVFAVVRDARDAGIRFVTEAIAAGRGIRGFEVDDAVRGHIEKKGFGQYFTHRTGHSIGRETHGNGANMDNFESHDDRSVIPGTCFSIEPGIYLPEFGVRSEVNLFIGEREARVTGEVQRELEVL